ncbi:hypothetical protein L2E82_27612 [Cichorium intybus]|uniref:Uncharacterized protein n=1 Tax=Cichorium intybus TaxID=13427 RepID=A0ACB9CTH3_CICIN|nr:hypothetical protein L2E82_27612 [Cichorium intybus]
MSLTARGIDFNAGEDRGRSGWKKILEKLHMTLSVTLDTWVPTPIHHFAFPYINTPPLSSVLAFVHDFLIPISIFSRFWEFDTPIPLLV